MGHPAVGQDAGENWKRSDAHRHADEEYEDALRYARRREARVEHERERRSSDQWDDDRGARQGKRGAKLPANDAGIEIKAHQKHIEHDTELRRRVQWRHRRGRNDLADHGRLVQSRERAPE